MDLKIKICGLIFMIVLTIKFIHGRDVPNVRKALRFNNHNREMQKHMKFDPRYQDSNRIWTLRPLNNSQATWSPYQKKFDPQSQDSNRIWTLRPLNNSQSTWSPYQKKFDPQSQDSNRIWTLRPLNNSQATWSPYQKKIDPQSQDSNRIWTLRPLNNSQATWSPYQKKFDPQSQDSNRIWTLRPLNNSQATWSPYQKKFDPQSQDSNRIWTLRPLNNSQTTWSPYQKKFDPQSQDSNRIRTLRPLNNSQATKSPYQKKFDPQSQDSNRIWTLRPLNNSQATWSPYQKKFDPKQVTFFPPPFVPIKNSKMIMNQAVQAGQAGLPSPRMYKFESAAPSQADSPYATTFTAEWSYGIIPYYIDEETADENLKRRIQKAMSLVEASSCVIFKEKANKSEDGETTSWLHFTNPQQQRECSHDTAEGDNNDIIIVLGIDCLKPRDILHSVLHGLGFKDEVSHPHRDKYIKILWENVQPKYRPLFRVRRDKALYKMVEYDPMSVMHFHDRDFSENGGLTIAPVMPGLVIEPSDNLSQLDVMQLRIKFGHECNKRKVGNLIDNCKNVLYHAEGNDDQEDNAAGNDDPESNAEGNDDQALNPAGNDTQKLKRIKKRV